MPYKDFVSWTPTLAVLASVLCVNFFIPIRTRLDHALATSIGAMAVWGAGAWAWAWVERAELILFQMSFLPIVVLVADFIGTFISFTDRIRNAVVTVIMFAALYFGLAIAIPFVLFGSTR